MARTPFPGFGDGLGFGGFVIFRTLTSFSSFFDRQDRAPPKFGLPLPPTSLTFTRRAGKGSHTIFFRDGVVEIVYLAPF